MESEGRRSSATETALSTSYGKEERRPQSRTVDPDKKSDPKLPRFRPEQEPQHVNLVFAREASAITTEGQYYKPSNRPEEESHFVNPIFAREAPRTTAGIQHYEPLTETSARPQDLSVKFVRKVPINDLAACDRFVKQYPALLHEPNLRAKYLDPAAQAWSVGDDDSKYLALSYLEKCSIITLTLGYQRHRKVDFLTLYRGGDTEATDAFLKTFQRYRNNCEEKAKSAGKTHPSMEDNDDVASQLKDLDIGRHSARPRRASTAQETPYRVSTNETQHDRDIPHAAKPVQETSRDSHRGASPEHDRVARSPNSDSYEEDLSRGGKTPRPLASRALIDDYRYQKLQSTDWHYFKPGRVFAIKTYLTDSTDKDDFSTIGVTTNGGYEVFEKIRRMLVIKEREGFCLVVPINTYDGQGLSRYGFRQNNINAHARIHMNNCLPVWLDQEPRPGKRDIIVEPEDEHQRLHPASRICFERQHSVDYNDKIMKIGTVRDKACLRYLQEYWNQEASRRLSQGQRRSNSNDQGARQKKDRSSNQIQDPKRRPEEKGRRER